MELQRTTETDADEPPVDWNVWAAVALLSILAGCLHFAAAWTHREMATLSGIFVMAALLQIGWGVALMLRPPRGVVVAGGVMNGLFVLFYLVTRFTGVGIEGLEDSQPFGVQDVVTTLLEVGAAAGAVLLLRPSLIFGTRTARLGPQGLALVGCVALVLAGPAFAATGGHAHHTDGHDHLDTAASAHEHAAGEEHAGGHAEGDDHDDSGHGDGDDHGDDHGDGGHADGDHRGTGHDNADGHHASGGGHDNADGHHASGAAHDDDGHAHGEETGEHAHEGETPGHEHQPGEDPHPHEPGPNPHPHPEEPQPGEYPAEWTPEQIAFADQLRAATEAAAVNYDTAAKAQAAGFSWIGDGAQAGGYQHWINLGRFNDGRILDPAYPESLVFRNTGAGIVLEASMFILPWNYNLGNIPSNIAWLPGWHQHDNLCFEGGGNLKGVVDANGNCPPGSFLIVTPPMLHVWTVPTICGPFAGVDENGLICEHEH